MTLIIKSKKKIDKKFVDYSCL